MAQTDFFSRVSQTTTNELSIEPLSLIAGAYFDFSMEQNASNSDR